MAVDVKVRRANLADAQSIADFVNASRSNSHVTRNGVMQRFGQVGFLIALEGQKIIGLLGWQVENLVVRVTDFLLGSAGTRNDTGHALISAMEAEGTTLLAEAAMLFLPPDPSESLIHYWEAIGYTHQKVQDLHRAWREAAAEWNTKADSVMVKRLRDSLTNRPI